MGRNQKCTFFAGLIQRQQLLVLLHERVWTVRHGKLPLSIQEAYYSSPMTKLTVEQLQLSSDDKAARLDLRAFMDPCPTLANELTPLRRVYWFFNQLGVRHLVVVDCREQVVGMLTRKDVLPESIEARVMAQDSEELKKLLQEKSTPRNAARPARGFQLFRVLSLGLSERSKSPKPGHNLGSQVQTTSTTADGLGASSSTQDARPQSPQRAVSFHPDASASS